MRYQIRHARVQFGGDVILRDVNFEVHDREKIAIVGRNGCGKTTLLKLIAGDIEMSNPDSDEECGITMAGGQEIGFLRQVNFVDAEVTVEDELKKVFAPVFACEERMKELEEQMKTAAETKGTAPDGALLREYDRLQKQMEAMRGYSWRRDMETMFQRFGFALEDLRRPIGSFSGGQQTKVAFIKLLLTRPDIMLLDEPTNHLDIHSREALENALASYGGTLLIVSHDRYLINKLADRIVWLGKTGTVNIDGNYDRYIELKEAKAQSEQAVQVKAAEGKKNDYKERKERESTLRKLSGALKRCEQAIDEIGLKTAELAQQMSQPEIATDYEKTSALAQEIEALKEKEEALTAEWMELSEQIESFT